MKIKNFTINRMRVIQKSNKRYVNNILMKKGYYIKIFNRNK
jgi:hypothetical protein